MIFRKLSIILLIFCLMIACGKKETSDLIVASWGGGYQESQRNAIFEPFKNKTGINLVETKTEYGKIREMVRKGDVTVDVADVETFFVYQAGEEGLLEPINYQVINKESIISNGTHKYGVGAVVWSTILAYNKDLTGDKIPTSWADIWDTKKFPGKRTLRDHPVSTLEIALLADGVEPESIYPIELNRAFKKLDEIKDKIVWWKDGDQPRQLLSSKEVIMASAWNGRVYAAIKDDQPLGICWNQGIMDLDWWVIPKGTKNRKLADRFLQYALSEEPQADQTNYISYGPTNKNAIDKSNKKILPFLPTNPENLNKQFFINAIWWAENEKEIKEKWDAWKLK